MATRLTRANTAATNRQKFTFSCWLKRGKLGAQENFFTSIHNGSNEFQFRFDSDDVLRWVGSISGSAAGLIKTNKKFRDISAWYNIVIVGDTTQATNINRLKLYINGVQIPDGDLNGPGYPGQNTNFGFGTTDYNFVFGTSSATGTNDPFTGLLSHCHFVDGATYQASTFGSTDATTGEWKINTSPTITEYGANGFFMFKNDASINDDSGKGNNFTLSGTITQTEDCPDNVFAVFNSSTYHFVNQWQANTNANTTVTGGSGSAWKTILTTIGDSSGKYYFEAKLISSGSGAIIGAVDIEDARQNSSSSWYIGQSSTGQGYQNNGAKSNGGASFGATFANDDIIGVAMDLDNSKIYFHKNGTYQDSGNPTSGSTGTGAMSLTADKTYAFALTSYAGTVWNANLGNGFFGTTQISSEGTNASGIGKFEYDVPAGYTALSTKGLNE